MVTKLSHAALTKKIQALEQEVLASHATITALQESVARYRPVIDNTHDLIHSVTPQGTFLFVNKAWRETLGYSPEEIKKLSLLEIIDESCRDKCQAIFTRMIQGENLDRNETIFVARDGRKILVEGRCNTLFHDGKSVAMTGIFRDISLQKKAEEYLRLDGLRLESLLALTHMRDRSEEEMIRFVMSRSEDLTHSSMGFFAFSNKPEQARGKYFCSQDMTNEWWLADQPVISPLAKPDIWTEAIRQRKPIIINDSPAPTPGRKGQQDVHLTPSRFLAVPILDAGSVVAIIGVANKQTDYEPFDVQQLELVSHSLWQQIKNQRTLKALHTSENNYRSIFHSANDAICVHNPLNGRILDANRKMEELYGYSEQELRRISVDDLSAGTAPYTQKEALAYIEKTKKEGPQIFEWLARNKTGQHFWVEVNLKLTTINGNKRLLALVRDITQRRQTEEALQQACKALEDQVARRTQDLTEANIALTVMLSRYEQNKKQLEQQILKNMKEKVSPLIERLKKSGLRDSQKNYIELVEGSINEILSPSAPGIGISLAKLTATEKTVAHLIMQEKTTKEIAAFLDISPTTISKHRENIRRKIGVTNKKKSLKKSFSSFF